MPYTESLDPYGFLHGRVDARSGGVGYALAGELDLASADEMRERLVVLSREHPGDLGVDMGGVVLLAATGIRALVSVRDQLAEHHHRLILSNVGGAPRRALRLTNSLDELDTE